MKRIIFFLGLMLFVHLEIHAQDYYGSSYNHKKTNLGISFSPNFHWLRYGDLDDVEKKASFGFSYGLLGDFAVSQNYYFSTGFLINTLRASSDYEDRPLTSYQVQYVEIPFGLKLQSTQRYYKSYYGQFGFSAGMKINGKRKLPNEKKTELGTRADVFRLAMQIGGGINWQLDHQLSFMTGLTFNNGFTGILKDGKPKSSYLAANFAIFF